MLDTEIIFEIGKKLRVGVSFEPFISFFGMRFFFYSIIVVNGDFQALFEGYGD